MLTQSIIDCSRRKTKDTEGGQSLEVDTTLVQEEEQYEMDTSLL